MLTLASILACALYLVPLVVLLTLVRRRSWSAVQLASALAALFAADFLATFALTYLVRVETAAFARLGLMAAAIGVAAWLRRRRKQDDVWRDSKLSRGDLYVMIAAGVVGFVVSYDASSNFWIWDREWHVPFTASLRGQTMPFRNLYEPGRPYRYHLSGNLFAALLQSLSFATMHASRALSLSHDLQSALLAVIGALTIRHATGWPPATSALAGVAPLLAGPIGLRSREQTSFGAYEGYSDFNNFTISFRPHCIMSLLLLAGLVATLLHLASAARDDARSSRSHALVALFPIVALSAICDEFSAATTCLAMAVVWAFSPRLVAPRRWQGLLLLGGLAIATVVANLALAGSVGPGGPVGTTKWVAPRLPHFFADPLPFGLKLEPWKQLFVDAGSIIVPALVVGWILIRDRRTPEPLHVLGRFALLVALFSLTLFLCFEMNGRTFEGHRFVTAARFTVPLVALMFASRLARASLGSVLLLAPIFAGVVVSLGFTYYRLPEAGRPDAAKEQYPINCRAEYGARLGARTKPIFVDSTFWYPFAGCHPIFAAPSAAPGDVVLVGWPDAGRTGYDKMDKSFFPAGAPARFVCSQDGAKRNDVCKDAVRIGKCSELTPSILACELPASHRGELRGR
jgi:hypothetical protein